MTRELVQKKKCMHVSYCMYMYVHVQYIGLAVNLPWVGQKADLLAIGLSVTCVQEEFKCALSCMKHGS